MWKDFINKLTDTCQFKEPISEKELLEVEKTLNLRFPDDLRSLLFESNGVEGEYGTDLVWSLERIKEDNLNFRASSSFAELYMPFDSLLFFGDAGNGDQFAFPILNLSLCKDDIFVWNHEDDSRQWVAPSLKTFVKWWIDGTIKI